MTTILTLKERPHVPLEAEGITVHRLAVRDGHVDLGGPHAGREHPGHIHLDVVLAGMYGQYRDLQNSL